MEILKRLIRFLPIILALNNFPPIIFSDFKINIMREVFSHLKYRSPANTNSCVTGPPWWYRDQFSPPSYYGPMSESEQYLRDKLCFPSESAFYDQFDGSFRKKK